jgi:hypothetical protein
MESGILNALVTLLIGGLLGGLLKSMTEMSTNILKDLWTNRYTSYLELWKITAVLPKYPKTNNVTFTNLLDASQRMRDWYFAGGGMLLTQKSKSLYFKLQEELLSNIKTPDDQTPINDTVYYKIQICFSHLRTSMTQDLLSQSRGGLWTAIQNIFK